MRLEELVHNNLAGTQTQSSQRNQTYHCTITIKWVLCEFVNGYDFVNGYEYFWHLVKLLCYYINHIISALFVHFQLNEREEYQRLSLSRVVRISKVEL